MEHTHDIPSIPEEYLKYLRLYWMEPTIYEFNSEIKEIDKNKIRLKDNYFYPEGGGQLSDRGSLSLKSRKYHVNDVSSEGDEIWLHLTNHDLEEGRKVHAQIDSLRRYSLSQHHTGQHLVSAVFHDLFGNDTTRAEINTEYSIVELNNSPSFEDLLIVQNKISELIHDNLEVQNKFYLSSETIDIPLRGTPEVQNLYRIVAIGNYDFNPCGGTHLTTTGALENIYFSKIESKKLRFMVGQPAVKVLNKQVIDNLNLARFLKVPVDELSDRIVDLSDKYEKLFKSHRKMTEDFIKLKIISEKFEKIGSYKIKFIELDYLDYSQLNSTIPQLNPQEGIFLMDKAGLFAFYSGSEILADQLKKAFLKQKIKCGGKGTKIMGNSSISFDKKLIKSIIG